MFRISSAQDFEIVDQGELRPISDFQPDLAGVSVALLFDVSGSMEHNLPSAREAATHLLSWLDPTDEAAVFTFDTQTQRGRAIHERSQDASRVDVDGDAFWRHVAARCDRPDG